MLKQTDISCFLQASEPTLKKKKRQRFQIADDEDRSSKLQYEEDYAEGYIRKLFERLDEKSFHDILSLIEGIEYQKDPALYKNILDAFKDHPDLQWEFLGFLEPAQAFECGKLMDYFQLCKVKEFCRKLQLNFKKQPQQVRKILDMLLKLAANPAVDMNQVNETIIPMLQKNPFLIQQFSGLFTNNKPPENLFSDELREEMNIYNENTVEEMIDMSHLEALPSVTSSAGCLYGCVDRSPSPHCPICNIKYINGQMYVTNGKFLRLVNIGFEVAEEENIKRLMSHDRVTRTRTNRRTENRANERPLSPAAAGTVIVWPTLAAVSVQPKQSEEDQTDLGVRKKRKSKGRAGLKNILKRKRRCKRIENNEARIDDAEGSCEDVADKEDAGNSSSCEEVASGVTLEKYQNGICPNLENIEFNITTAPISSLKVQPPGDSHKHSRNPIKNLF